MVKQHGDKKIDVRPRTMAYGPDSLGSPGQFIIHPNASISAWKHEFQHFLDDKASGYQGRSLLANPNKRFELEARAYNEEMRFARRMGYHHLVGELKALLTDEWIRIKKPHLNQR